MQKFKFITSLFTAFLLTGHVIAQTDSISSEHHIKEVVVKASNGTKSKFQTANMEIIGQQQLIRAACCNLGESFTTNPSVDVSYTDAATGAKQIKLLGLSGTYVQMLTENVPNLRGVAIPYSLNYVPGPWMQSIQVSKGASSVKNGYESTTGQINIEYQKPQGEDGVRGNAYLDSKLKYEVNADASIHLNDRLSTSLLIHYDDRQSTHDSNHDSFMDMPKQRQYNIMHRWAYVSPRWISQLSMRALHEQRISGTHHTSLNNNIAPFHIDIDNARYEIQWKNGLTLNADHNTSIALMTHGSWHEANNLFGSARQYDVIQKNGYAQLMFESNINDSHNIALGSSFNYDKFDEYYKDVAAILDDKIKSSEAVSGLYAQYTYKLQDRLTVMAGLRYDYSSIWKSFLTPRLHVKFTPSEILTIRASAGKGYRTAHSMAENSPLLATGRAILMDKTAHGFGTMREEAWNYGISASMNIPVGDKNLELNAEYYYTDFLKQLNINVHPNGDTPYTSFEALNGKSYSHTIQIDATYPFLEGFSATGAFRINDVRTTYDGELHRRPLTSFYKGLLTLSYKTPMELWHFDITGNINGGGELYDHSSYPSFFQLQAQITREFRKFSIYLGGENLTNYRIPTPIINAANPYSNSFDATQIWGPTEGIMTYIGLRLKL